MIYALDGTTGLYILRFDAPTRIREDRTGSAPAEYALLSNYPNPFNGRTAIEFTIAQPGFTEVEVFDLSGRVATTLHRGFSQAGKQRVFWNGNDEAGQQLPSGIYFVRLSARGLSASRKMLLLR